MCRGRTWIRRPIPHTSRSPPVGISLRCLPSDRRRRARSRAACCRACGCARPSLTPMATPCGRSGPRRRALRWPRSAPRRCSSSRRTTRRRRHGRLRHTQSGYVGTNASREHDEPRAWRAASLSAHALSMVASRSRNTGVACTAATLSDVRIALRYPKTTPDKEGSHAFARTATARWEGGLKDGKGRCASAAAPSRASTRSPSRFEEGTGTNPEELIGPPTPAASRWPVRGAGRAGFMPTSVETTAKVHLENGETGFASPASS